jgi:hypothetical protein
MSNYSCEICGRVQVDSERGYIAGCAHHPPERERMVTVYFGGDVPSAKAFYVGAWYKSKSAMAQGRSVHPVSWSEVDGEIT